CGVTRPLASNLNYVAGKVVANNVIAPISNEGSVCLYSSSPSDVIVDIAGWFSDDSAGAFVGTTPTRLVDTRDGTGPAPD
ncbi:MAG: SGNH/GDSL hydrolase family protein, partial [bacterium]